MNNIYEIKEKAVIFDMAKAEKKEYNYIYKRRLGFMFYQNRVVGTVEHTKRKLYKVTLTANTPERCIFSEIHVRTDKCYHPAFVLIKTVYDHNYLVYEMLGFEETPDSVYNM